MSMNPWPPGDHNLYTPTCAVHCLHLGGPAGDGWCCWCDQHIASPSADTGGNNSAVLTGAHDAGSPGGPYYPLIAAQRGNWS